MIYEKCYYRATRILHMEYMKRVYKWRHYISFMVFYTLSYNLKHETKHFLEEKKQEDMGQWILLFELLLLWCFSFFCID